MPGRASRFAWRLGVLVVLVCLGACTAWHSAPPDTPQWMSLIGSVAYREKIALGPDAITVIELIDVSAPEGSPRVVARTEVSRANQVPIPFELRVDARDIAAQHRYALHAAIIEGRRTLFETPADVAVNPLLGQPANIMVSIVNSPISLADVVHPTD